MLCWHLEHDLKRHIGFMMARVSNEHLRQAQHSSVLILVAFSHCFFSLLLPLHVQGFSSRLLKMKRFLIFLALLTAFGANAHATDLEATIAAGSFPFTAQIALTNLTVLENPDLNLGFVLSTERAGILIGAGFDFGPLGRASTDTSFDLLYAGGVRFSTNVRGTLGPIALELDGGFWTASSFAANRLSIFERNPVAASNNSFLVGANAQYRLARNLTLKVAGRYLPESSRVAVGLETRSGEFTLFGGGLLAPQTSGLTFGATLGLKFVPEDAPYRLGAEILLGGNPNGFTYGLGIDASYDFLNADEEKIGNLSAFFAFEPWREDIALPLRFGTNLEFNLGPGALLARGFGGSSAAGIFFYGFQFGYRLNIESLLGT
jgi:opacity protein-like surface antigen